MNQGGEVYILTRDAFFGSSEFDSNRRHSYATADEARSLGSACLTEFALIRCHGHSSKIHQPLLHRLLAASVGSACITDLPGF